jgi:hypothetical protein
VVYSSPIFRSTEITSSVLTSWVFIDALTASSHGNLPCLAALESSTEQLNTNLKSHTILYTSIQNTNIIVHLMGRKGLAAQWPLISITAVLVTPVLSGI